MPEDVVGEAYIALQASFDTFREDLSQVQKEVENAVAPAQKKFQELGASVSNVGKKMSIGVTAPMAAIGTAAFSAGDSIDDALDTIRTGTGATGPALEALGEDFKAVFADVPQDAATVSSALADINTRLGLTGKPLQDVTKQMLDLSRIAGTDVSTTIEAATRLFGDWSVATEDQADTLDYLWKVSQNTGIGVDSLSQKMVQFGAPLRQMGFSFEESAALMGKWEKEGVNSELVLGSLRIAMGNFARDNVPMQEGLDKTIQKIQELGPGAEATSLAMDVFGARAGPDMAAAILEGRFAVEDLMGVIATSPETISSASDDISGFSEAMGEMKNEVMLAIEPLGTALLNAFEQLKPHLEAAIGALTGLIEKFANLDPKMQTVILTVAGVVAAIGPLMMVLGPLISVIGSVVGALGAVTAAMAGGATGIGILTTAFPGLGAAFTALTGPIGIVIAAVAGAIAIGVLLYKNWDEISKWLSDTWNWIAETASGIWNSVVEFFAGIWESMSTTITDVWNSVVEFLYEKWNGIKDTARAIWEGIKGFIQNPIQSVKNWLGPTWDTIAGKLGGVWNRIKSTASSVWGGITSIIKGTINGIIGFINRFIRAFNRIEIRVPSIDIPLVGEVGGWTIGLPNIPTIPTLAEGGIVTAPTLAMVGEAGPEAVMPLSDASWMDRLADRIAEALRDNISQSSAMAGGNGDIYVYIGNEQVDAYIQRSQDRRSIRSNGR